ncbi:MAG: tetratricopeptide repeat protein [Crocinitomicaceae bacterium]
MLTRITHYLTLFLLLTFQSAFLNAQEFGNKNFYLIDSLKLKSLSSSDRELLDTNLVKYHNTLNDTVELAILEYIVDNCWDSDVWPKYNALIIDIIEKKSVIKQSEKVRDKFTYFLAGALSNIGYMYDEKGDLLHALEYYHKGLYLYERIQNKKGAARTLNNLGVIYSLVGDSSKAFDYHRRSLKAKSEMGDHKGVAMSFNNMGTIYENYNQPFKALKYFESSLEISKEIDNKRGIAMAYDNIGDIYASQHIYGKAYQYYQKGLAIWKETGIEVGISTSLDNMANVLLEMGKPEEAKQHALESYEIAQKLGFPMDIENSSKTLTVIYKKERNYEKALHFSEVYIDMREKVRNQDNTNTAFKKSMQYEYQKEALKDSLEYEKEREVSSLKLREKETQTYALFGGIGLLSLFLLYAIKSYQQKKRDNKKINEQKQKVEVQKVEIEKQHIRLASTHKEISDSISYAKRIQDAILPEEAFIQQYLKSAFVMYEPKDVVSGDFYWLNRREGLTLLAVGDCTGHGVPGAMVSIVCHNALTRVVRELNITNPAEILNKTREIVIETFASKQSNVKDGMDISLISLTHGTESEDGNQSVMLHYAGANNPLYIIRKEKVDEVEIIAADKQPIGNFEKAKPFTGHNIRMNSGDLFYLFTDGFMDQFGGENGKKYKYSRFRELLLSICDKTTTEQRKILEEEFHLWKGTLEQLDDVCVIGVRV